jgi:septal ring factor EnvC (AmiA/AmiB activator)
VNDREGPSAPGGTGDAFRDMVTQFAELAARIASMGADGAAGAAGRSGASDQAAALNDLLTQVQSPIAQLETVVREIRSRRQQVQAVRAQLAAFDEQLAALEATLLPLLEWSRTWSRLQQTLLDPFRITGSADDPRRPRQ